MDEMTTYLNNTLAARQTDTACGQILVNGINETADINLSSMLSTLIKEAAKCKTYASDLFISWESIMKRLDKPIIPLSNILPFTEYFGFRENGVDNNFGIYTKLTDKAKDEEPIYISIYRLDMWQEESNVFASLKKVKSRN